MIPTYLSFCIEMALREADYVPTRLEYLVLCMQCPRDE